MSRLGSMISTELSLLGWDRLMSPESSFLGSDIRKWTIHAMSKAIWKFVYEQNDLEVIANGSFVNNSNFPPGTAPYPQATVNIKLTGWLRVPSQKKLYDILLPWVAHSDNPADVWIDTFQRIFIDWLGVLEVHAGQDGETPLPMVIPPIANALPPYFHSINGSTLLVNRFIPSIENPTPSNFPVDSGSSPSSGMDTPMPDSSIIDAKTAELARWDGLRVDAVVVESNAKNAWTGSLDLAELERLRQPYRDRWQVSLEKLRLEQAELESKSDVDPVLLSDIVAKIDNIHKNALSYADVDYPSATARIEMIDYEKDLVAKEDSSNATLPTKEPVGTAHPDALELEPCQILEPTQPDYELPPIVAWYSIPPSITFPSCVNHAQECFSELSTASISSMEEAWDIIGKHIANALNDHLKVVGGGSGYAYGSPVNPWTGSIIIKSCEWNDK